MQRNWLRWWSWKCNNSIISPSSFINWLYFFKIRFIQRLDRRHRVYRIEIKGRRSLNCNNRHRNSKLLTLLLDLSKSFIRILHFIYLLRILQYNHKSFLIQDICSIRTRHPRRRGKSTDLNKLFNRHDMYFYMLILPPKNLFLLIGILGYIF